MSIESVLCLKKCCTVKMKKRHNVQSKEMALFTLSSKSIQKKIVHLLLAIEINGWTQPCLNAILFVYFAVFCPNNNGICIPITIYWDWTKRTLEQALKTDRINIYASCFQLTASLFIEQYHWGQRSSKFFGMFEGWNMF